MYTKDAIRYALTMSDQAVLRSLETIEDAPLTFPTENGGCHPLWVIGHLAFVEGITNEMLGGGTNPVGDWAPMFGQDTIPSGTPAFILHCEKSATIRETPARQSGSPGIDKGSGSR